MGLIYLSILLIAIAFLIVVVYVSIVMNRLTKTMKSLSTTLSGVEKQVQEMTPQLATTLKEADRLLDDATDKSGATESLFDSVQLLGESLQSANSAIQNSLSSLTEEEMDEKVKPYIKGMKWSEVAVTLYERWRQHKPNQNNTATGREG